MWCLQGQGGTLRRSKQQDLGSRLCIARPPGNYALQLRICISGNRRRSVWARRSRPPTRASHARSGSSSAGCQGPSHGDGSSIIQLIGAWGDLSRRLRYLAGSVDNADFGFTDAAVSPGKQQQQQEGKQQQRQHQQDDERMTGLVLEALKLALRCLAHQPPRRDGRRPTERALGLAAALADLAAAGLPLDAPCIAAGIVADAVDMQLLNIRSVEAKLGVEVSGLVQDMLAVRHIPERVELYDDEASSAIRDWVLSAYDVRGAVLEVVSRWVGTAHMCALPVYEQQLVALEALQIFAPLGHALGLGLLSSQMEDAAFQVLFPHSYAATGHWMRSLSTRAHAVLDRVRDQLQAVVDSDPEFNELAGGCELHIRTKSHYSVMRKLLRLGNMSAGGRRRDELYDLLGLRAVVVPRSDISRDEAEAAATAACYRVQQLAHDLWSPLPGRSKDYVSSPKANGYQSLHSTVRLATLPGYSDGCWSDGTFTGSTTTMSSWEEEQQSDSRGAPPSLARCSMPANGHASSSSREPAGGNSTPLSAAESEVEQSVLCHLELQVRTAAMHAAAERGDAAHAAYKGGLQRGQVRKLKGWTLELQRRLAGKKQLQLPAGSTLTPAALLPAVTGQLAQQIDWAASPPAAAVTATSSPSVPAAAPLTAAAAAPGSQCAPLQPAAEASPSPSPRSSSPSSRGDAASQLFRHLDLDGDGQLSLAELEMLLSELEGPAAARGAAGLLSALDTNGDQLVSRDEFLGFWGRLHGSEQGVALQVLPSGSNSGDPQPRHDKGVSNSASGSSSSSSLHRPTAATATRVAPRLMGSALHRASRTQGRRTPATTRRRLSLAPSALQQAVHDSSSSSSSSVRLYSGLGLFRRRAVGQGLVAPMLSHWGAASGCSSGSGGSVNMPMCLGSSTATPGGPVPGAARRRGGFMCRATVPGGGSFSSEGDVGREVESTEQQEQQGQQEEQQHQPRSEQRKLLWPVNGGSVGHQPGRQQLQPGAATSPAGSSSSSSISSSSSLWSERPPPRPRRPQRTSSQTAEAEGKQQQDGPRMPADMEQGPRDQLLWGSPSPSLLEQESWVPDLDIRITGAPCEHRASQLEMPVVPVPRHGPLLLTNSTTTFPASDLAVDAGTPAGEQLCAVMEMVPAVISRSTGETTREGGLYLRNLSRFVRGRRRQAALWVNGVPLPPQAEAVLLQPGDTVDLGETGVTFEVLAAASPHPSAVEIAAARYLGSIGPQQQQEQVAAGAPQQQQPPQVYGAPSRQARSSSGFSSDSEGWDDGDETDEDREDNPSTAGRSPYDQRVAAAYSLARGNPASAERQLVLLLAEAPATAAAWFVWAQLAMGSRRLSLARDLFRAAAAAAKAELSAAEAVGLASMQGALQPLSARLAKVLRVWARMEWDASLYGAARRLWRAAANEAFRYPRRLAADVGGVVLHAWASAEFERDNLRNARTVIGEALRKCSTDTAINILAGSIVHRTGDVEGARALFLRAYQLDRRAKREKQLYIAWPRLEAEAGNLERARVLYQRGLSMFPNSSKLINVYATFEAKQGNAELARQLHQHALSIDPRSVTTMHNRVSWATMELDLGNREAARQLLREGLDLHPTFSAALVVMARLERLEGNLDLAEAYVRRALKASNAFNISATGELRALYKARGEAELEANLGRHMDNMGELRQAKRSGAAWGSEAWERYAERTRSPEQRRIIDAAWQRKRELGLIRPREHRGAAGPGGSSSGWVPSWAVRGGGGRGVNGSGGDGGCRQQQWHPPGQHLQQRQSEDQGSTIDESAQAASAVQPPAS